MSKPKRDIKIRVDITYQDALAYIREGLRRDGLVAPEGDDCFMINGDAGNPDDVLVEVVGVSVAQPERPAGVSLAELRALRTGGDEEEEEEEIKKPAKKKKPRAPDEPRTLVHDEDDSTLEKEIRSFNRTVPKVPEVGPKANEVAKRRPRVGESLEAMGKDPHDMSDEI